METPAPIATAAPACRFLRNKRMYIPALSLQASPGDPNQIDDSFYWCNRTLATLGRDDERVHPCLCQPGRSCHEA
jgi:hypothetical protein